MTLESEFDMKQLRCRKTYGGEIKVWRLKKREDKGQEGENRMREDAQ